MAIIEYEEIDDQGVFIEKVCSECGSPAESEECVDCQGRGLGPKFKAENVSIQYECVTCEGAGGYWYCPACTAHHALTGD